MPPNERAAALGTTPDTAAATHTTRTALTQSNPSKRTERRAATVAVADAELHPPAGRRRLPLLLVRSCPACRHLHIHRGTGIAGSGVRTGSCGVVYQLHVLPAQQGRAA